MRELFDMGSPKGCVSRTRPKMTDDSYRENQEKKNIKLRKKSPCMSQYNPHSGLGKETENGGGKRNRGRKRNLTNVNLIYYDVSVNI